MNLSVLEIHENTPATNIAILIALIKSIIILPFIVTLLPHVSSRYNDIIKPIILMSIADVKY